MRPHTSGGFAVAALGAALIVAGAFPVSAQIARPLSALAASDSNQDLVTPVARRGGGGGRGGGRVGRGGGGGRVGLAHRGGYRAIHRGGVGAHRVAARHHWHRRPHRHRHHHHHGGGWWWGAGTGFALGYGLGYGYPYGYGYGYGYDPYYYGRAAYVDAPIYCLKRVRVYDRNKKTYVNVRKRRVCG